MQDNMQVRYLDWAESLTHQQKHAAMPDESSSSANQKAERLQAQSAAQSPAPHVPFDKTFDVIVGTDILYEVWSDLVSAVV